jgi:hypothetical protein
MGQTVTEDRPGDDAAPAVGAVERAGWRGVLREFATIVAGVLVALAGQAWWSAREARGLERDYLRQLFVDTRENARRLDASIAREGRVRTSQEALATALYAPRPLPSADSLRRLLDGPVFSAGTFDPVVGTYTALVSTGDLRLIRNDSLRSQLVAYAGLLDHLHAMQQFYLQQAFGEPARMARSVPSFASEMAQLTAVEQAVVRAREAPRLLHMRDDPDFAGVLFTLQISNINRAGNLRTERTATEALLRALAAEPALADRAAPFLAEQRARADSVRVDSVRAAGVRASVATPR